MDFFYFGYEELPRRMQMIAVLTFNNQLENTSYHSSGFFINKPVVVIFRVFFVSVDGIRSQMLE